jgi:hypothetical protein
MARPNVGPKIAPRPSRLRWPGPKPIQLKIAPKQTALGTDYDDAGGGGGEERAHGRGDEPEHDRQFGLRSCASVIDP